MSENQTPPSPQGKPSQGRQADEVMQQAQQMVTQLGIDINTGIMVLVLAVVSAIVAALLDEILGLPTNALLFTFGWIVAALNGPTYAILKGAYNLPGLIMSAVAGLVAFLVWYIAYDIVSNSYLTYNFNVFKTILTGAIVGVVAFGWIVLLHRLPKNLLSRGR